MILAEAMKCRLDVGLSIKEQVSVQGKAAYGEHMRV